MYLFMDILLDTNFVITCVKHKLDFDAQINDITDEKVRWIVPEDVVSELEDIKNRKGIKFLDRRAAGIAIDLINLIDSHMIELKGRNPNVDIKIASYLKKNKNVVLATLDKKLKSRVKNKILTTRGKKKLAFV